jgi:cell wall-associated NlpC family hydrolase
VQRLIPVAALGAIGALVLGLAVLGAAVSGSATSSAAMAADAVWTAIDDSMCATAAPGPLGGLTPAQTQNAQTVVSVADAMSGEKPQAAQIALMTALTESDLTDDPGGMGGAMGLFQQTPPSWGSPAALLDPAYAAGAFVQHLLQVSAWQSLPPWQAAQDVQRSGAGQPSSPLNPAPGTLGGNYEVHWAEAQQVYGMLTGAWTHVGCGAGPIGGVAGPPGSHGLPARYAIPPGTSRRAMVVIDYALAQLGKPYVWGAAGPNAFDCSGLTMSAWAHAGVSLAHYTVTQEHEGRPVPAGQVAAGDLVLIPGSDPPGPGLPGHVGIYLGDGLVLSAIDQEEGVAVQSWPTFVGGGLDAVVDPS